MVILWVSLYIYINEADISIQMEFKKNNIINALVGIPAQASPRPPRVKDPPRIYGQGSSSDLSPATGGPPKRGRTSCYNVLVNMNVR